MSANWDQWVVDRTLFKMQEKMNREDTLVRAK